jgi:SAM-dependent methyltransferase
MTDHRNDVNATIQTYDRIASSFAERTWNLPLDAMRTAFLDALAASHSGRPLRILDAGCGPGRDVAWFRAHGHQAVGADLSDGILAEAQRRVPGAPFVRMDLRAPSFAPRSFDGIRLSACLVHVPKLSWVSTLRNYRLLLDGGRLFLSVKHGEGERMVGERFFSYTSEEELASLLWEAGFTVVWQSRSPGEPEHDWLVVHVIPR